MEDLYIESYYFNSAEFGRNGLFGSAPTVIKSINGWAELICLNDPSFTKLYVKFL